MISNRLKNKTSKLLEDGELKKLLKIKTPKKIIYMHCHRIINLSSKQLDNLIKLKNR